MQFYTLKNDSYNISLKTEAHKLYQVTRIDSKFYCIFIDLKLIWNEIINI
jgi:hypothetical protein